MPPWVTHYIVIVAILVLIAWRMHARIRRLVGRQPLSPVRPWITLVLFPVLLLTLLGSVGYQHTAILYLAGGVLPGIVLGIVGIRLTRFEVTPAGRFYTPSAHIGVALSLLLVGRIAWRFLSTGLPGAAFTGGAYAGSPTSGAAPPGASLTPFTLLLLGTLAGYYSTYAAGLIRWSRAHRGAEPDTPK